MTQLAASGDTGRQPRDVRRPHQQTASGMGASVSASFVGLLLLGKPEHLLSAEGERNTALPAGAVPADGGETAGHTADAGLQALLTNTPALVPNTSFSAGEAIDVEALTRLSGGVRLGNVEGGNGDVLAAAQTASAGNETEAALPEGGIELAAAGLAGEPEAAAPPVEAVPDEEGLGDVGEAVVGTDGDDVIVGSDADDGLAGGGGDDTIYGAGGDDAIEGNTGDDGLYGGGGDDLLDGGEGNDLLDGGEGDDLLDGGTGNDVLIGGEGLDELRGGLGDDVLQIDHFADFALEDGGDGVGGGDDILAVEDGYASSLKSTFPWLTSDGSATFVLGDDLTRGAPEGANDYTQRVPDAIESVDLKGTTAHDLAGDGRDNRLFGNAGDNMIHGGDGADTLAGDGGDDMLYGEAGDDMLLTGDGTDTLYGGGGDDLYLIGLAEGPADTIFDHEGANRLRVDGTGGLEARLDGDSLVVSRGGADVARIDGYVGHETAFQTVEYDGESHDLASLLPAKPMSAALPADMLAGFMDAPAVAPSFGLDEPAAAYALEPDELPVFFDDPGHHAADLTGLGGIETMTAHESMPGAARGLERLAFSREG